MNDWFWLILLAVLPISELRGSIPYGILVGLPVSLVIVISIIANIAAGIFAYFFLDRLIKLFFNFGLFKEYYQKIVERSQKKIKEAVDKYGWIGVAIFIGIPLPFTGAWTGALGSYLIGLKKKKTMAAIILGVVIAGAIVSIIMLSGIEILKRIFIKSI